MVCDGMRIVITGTPGTGKTTIARTLGKHLDYPVVNEGAFAKAHHIGTVNRKTKEREISLPLFTQKLNQYLRTHPKAIVEGHLGCECKFRPVDVVVVVRLSPDRLEFRLRERGYAEVKIQDNVLCEGIDYCLKHAKRNYPASKIREIQNDKELKQTILTIIKKIKKK